MLLRNVSKNQSWAAEELLAAGGECAELASRVMRDISSEQDKKIKPSQRRSEDRPVAGCSVRTSP